jgi:deoxyribonuclease V
MNQVHTHPWEVSVKEAYQIQRDLRTRVFLRNGFRQVSTVAAADVAFDERRKKAYAAAVVLSLQDFRVLEAKEAVVDVAFPYVPGLLSFREGRPLLTVLELLQIEPDVILFDGQGIAHPRGLGLATHMGILLEKPTIGCAKTKLAGEHKPPPLDKGGAEPLLLAGKKVGFALRTKLKMDPIYVSPGHLVDVDTALEIVKYCAREHRIPEPVRIADQKSRELKAKANRR